MKYAGLRLLLLALIAVTAGAGAPPRPTGNVVNIDIADLQYSPNAVEVHVGDVVQWSNADFVDHTATARDGAFDLTIPAGGMQRMVAAGQGTFAYICRTHPNMEGTLSVLP